MNGAEDRRYVARTWASTPTIMGSIQDPTRRASEQAAGTAATTLLLPLGAALHSLAAPNHGHGAWPDSGQIIA